MPKLAGLALADAQPARRRPEYILVFWLLFAIPLFAIHYGLLTLPFFWDELGQFVPAALDIARTGSWIPHSTIPNVHPPGVEAYLALLYKVFGYSIPLTRAAMLVVASAGLLVTFLLAIELSPATRGAPAFLPPLLLLASPLFYTQSMMAQLDMPAMVLTLLALLLFVKRQYAWAAVVSVALVLTKETGIVAPAVFFVALATKKQWRLASWFLIAPVALFVWLLYLRSQTSYWLGDPGFAHYNVEYALQPIRVLMSFARRLYYLFFAEFRWIGTLLIVYAFRRCEPFRRSSWKIAASVAAANLVLVSILGGAELERYLLPSLGIFYIAVAAVTCVPKKLSVVSMAALIVGLVANLWWNPPYPFPYENNLAVVDFVHLQQTAAGFVEDTLPGQTVATAWPYTAALRNPEYGFVKRRVSTRETGDFHYDNVRRVLNAPDPPDVLITYTRSWTPLDITQYPIVRSILSRYYDWQPDITPDECAGLGFDQTASWLSHGQQITVYVRKQAHSARLGPVVHVKH